MKAAVVTKLALQIAPHVFVRPGELRHAEWSEIDLDGALWVIPAGKMKMRKAHHVPLSRQAGELFRQVRVMTGPNGFVFTSIRTRARPMSENTVNAALRRLGEPHTAKGYQSDYDLLSIVNDKRVADRLNYWLKLEERLNREFSITKALRPPVNFIVHTLQEVNDGLAHGRYFFMDLAKDGIALYQ